MKIKVTVDAAVMPDLSKELKNAEIKQKASLNVGVMDVKAIEKAKENKSEKVKEDEYNELI